MRREVEGCGCAMELGVLQSARVMLTSRVFLGRHREERRGVGRQEVIEVRYC